MSLEDRMVSQWCCWFNGDAIHVIVLTKSFLLPFKSFLFPSTTHKLYNLQPTRTMKALHFQECVFPFLSFPFLSPLRIFFFEYQFVFFKNSFCLFIFILSVHFLSLLQVECVFLVLSRVIFNLCYYYYWRGGGFWIWDPIHLFFFPLLGSLSPSRRKSSLDYQLLTSYLI